MRPPARRLCPCFLALVLQIDCALTPDGAHLAALAPVLNLAPLVLPEVFVLVLYNAVVLVPVTLLVILVPALVPVAVVALVL